MRISSATNIKINLTVLGKTGGGDEGKRNG